MQEADIRLKTAQLVDAYKRMNKQDSSKNHAQAQEVVDSLIVELVTQVLIDLHTLAEATKFIAEQMPPSYLRER